MFFGIHLIEIRYALALAPDQISTSFFLVEKGWDGANSYVNTGKDMLEKVMDLKRYYYKM